MFVDWLWYRSEGYRLYDPDREKVFFNRDVTFNKFEVGFKESSMVEPLSYVELEGSVDDSEVGGDVDADVVGKVDNQSHQRRSERVRRRPNYYSEGAFIVADGAEEPILYQEAIASPNKSK